MNSDAGGLRSLKLLIRPPVRVKTPEHRQGLVSVWLKPQGVLGIKYRDQGDEMRRSSLEVKRVPISEFPVSLRTHLEPG